MNWNKPTEVTMFRTLTLIQLVWLIFGLEFMVEAESIFKRSKRVELTFPELAQYDGYQSETHTVTTDDGYILILFRLPASEKCRQITKKTPLLFMHGMYLSGDDCIIPGPGDAHCYIYADNCYDVWVGNSRGNRYSRNHTTLNPDTDSEFWNFDFDTLANHDLSATINYVLSVTGQSKLVFVGHSQGITLLLVLCSEKPEFNDKIKIAYGLSPTAWLGNSSFSVLRFQSLLAPAVLTASGARLNREIVPHGGIAQKSVEKICGASHFSYQLCSTAYFSLLGYDGYQITDEVFPVVAGHTPAGTSLKNFARWGQIKNNGFCKYDYGATKNLENYGTTTPAPYDLQKITAKIVLLAGEGDNLGHVKDVRILASQLPIVDTYIVPNKKFGHLDFIYGKDLKTYIAPIILSGK